MFEQFLMYWLLWLLFIIIFFFMEKSKKRTMLTIWLLFIITFSSTYMNIHIAQVSLSMIIIIFVVFIFLSESQFFFCYIYYFFFCSFTLLVCCSGIVFFIRIFYDSCSSCLSFDSFIQTATKCLRLYFTRNIFWSTFI